MPTRSNSFANALIWPLSLAFLLGGCVKLDEHGFDDAKLQADVKSSAPIEMADYTHFAWDRFYVYVPQSTRESIRQEIGSGVPYPHKELETHCLVVFVAGGKVSAAFEEARNSVDLINLAQKGGYARADASFRGKVAADGTLQLLKR